jgi:hypothetical protein
MGVRTPRLGVLAAVSLVAGTLSSTAAAHAPVGRAPLGEARLQALETRLLGAGHAREHALARRADRLSRPVQRRAVKRGTVKRGAARRRLLAAGPADQVGRWAAPIPIPGVAINTAVLPTGKILYYPGGGIAQKAVRAFVWDPRTGAVKAVPPPKEPDGTTINIFCSGTSFLADGRVLAAGGQVTGYTLEGEPTVFTFNPFTEAWTRHEDMRLGRWYPTQRLLPDGRTVIIAGTTEEGAGHPNPDIELFSPDTNTTDVIGTLGAGGMPPIGGFYPHMFALPSGRTLVAGPTRSDSWLFRLAEGSTAFTWEDVPPLDVTREWATGVHLPGGPEGSTQAMIIGGSDAPLATSLLYDEAGPNAWQTAPSLKVGRGHHNTVILPDGSMVTVGGGYGARPNPDGSDNLRAADPATHRQIELYDPATRTWRLGPEQAELRTYHSTAVLLPDGRVMSAGGDGLNEGGADNDTIEIYEPPYLHRGPRPRLTALPAAAGYGQRIPIGATADATAAVLVAPGAVTHANDMNQRLLRLAVTPRADGYGLDAVLPAGANLAPPGYYMVFVLNDRGVPSEAQFIRLQQAPVDIPEPTPPTPPVTPDPVAPPVVAPPVVADPGTTAPPVVAPPTTPARPRIAVAFGRPSIAVSSGRRTTVVLRARRGTAPAARLRITLNWRRVPGTWTVVTDRRGIARVLLTGRRAGILEARAARSKAVLRVSLVSPLRRR